jgi:predicted nucleic acid-binding protein
MIVLDASAVIELVLSTSAGSEVARRIGDGSPSLHAPHLIGVEVAQVLRRYAARKVISTDVGAAALSDVGALDIERYEHELLLPRVWMLRENLTAYDAVYVALAEVLDAPLLTADRRIARAPGHGARVEVVGGEART